VGTPAPLPAAGGSWIEPLASPRGIYLAAAFERAPGTLAEELDFALWDQARFAHLGQAVGRFHAASRSYQPAPGLDRPDWDQAGSCFNPPEEIADEALRLRRAEAWRAVQALPRDPAAWGWIHADLHGGNFMLDPLSGRITLLDFDDCARGWYVMDIAMLLHDFLVLCPWEDKAVFAEHFMRAFLPAYLATMPLDGVWIERLPLFLKLVETGIYAQVAEFADSMEPDSWVGRFMHGRRQRIAGAVPVVDLDFGRVYRECRP
jgi:Ser/Thr protein kinase RdoA (MazF antagonist)